MKSQPIVFKKGNQNEQDDNEWEPVDDKFRSKFPFVVRIKKRLAIKGRNLKVKFDVLTKKSFKETI